MLLLSFHKSDLPSSSVSLARQLADKYTYYRLSSSLLGYLTLFYNFKKS
jgi:hypothetical protein